MLVGVDPQQLPAGALVAVVHGKAGDHLGHHQAGSVALGLQAYEPVADPGQGREHDAVGEANRAERPRLGQISRWRLGQLGNGGGGDGHGIESWYE
jgi:hypothetical protein